MVLLEHLDKGWGGQPCLSRLFPKGVFFEIHCPLGRLVAPNGRAGGHGGVYELLVVVLLWWWL